MISPVCIDEKIMIGLKYPIRVNCNVGINYENQFENEIKKIKYLVNKKETCPDLFMDLSMCSSNPKLYSFIKTEYGIPVGTVPIYTAMYDNKYLDKTYFFDTLEDMLQSGISFITLHFTADRHLFEIAKQDRLIPSTSRGGMLMLQDQLANNKENFFMENFSVIVKLARKYNTVISIGTTFRPASTLDALDRVHILETKKQIKISRILRREKVSFIVENVGHINIRDIERHSKLLRKFRAPIMPLGPLPTDTAINMDHLVNSVGATVLGLSNIVGIINSITPQEHSCEIFSKKNLADGVRAAKLTAYMLNLRNGTISNMNEIEIYKKRAKNNSCLMNRDCRRCLFACPLKR